MTRLDQILRLGIGLDRGQDRGRTIGRRDTGRDTLRRLDRDREIGRLELVVAVDHQRQAQLTTALLGQGHADQTTAVLGHEVDRLRGGRFRGDDQIALVFTVLIIHDDDHAALAQIFDDFFSSIQCHLVATGSANAAV